MLGRGYGLRNVFNGHSALGCKEVRRLECSSFDTRVKKIINTDSALVWPLVPG